jgi:hypothetical protein
MRAAEQEPEPPRPIDLEILATMLGIAVGAPIDDEETAPDPGVDVAADDLAAFGREQEMGRLVRIKPRVEYSVGRRRDLASS